MCSFNNITNIQPASFLFLSPLQFIAEKNPGSYGWMFRYGDEIYALLDLILQNHFLAKTSKYVEVSRTLLCLSV